MASAVLSETKSNVYNAVTAQIVAAIEAGAGHCTMPWHGCIASVMMPVNAATEIPYHGVNGVALWAQAATKRYVTGYWASYAQWRKLGAQVRGGERGSLIIFYKKLETASSNETDADTEALRFVIRASHVFNVEQVDGWEIPRRKRLSEVETNEQIEAFVRATKAEVRHGSTRACYHRRGDYIEMPGPEQFTGKYCGATDVPCEVHHVRKLADMKNTPLWQQVAAARRRKRVVLCLPCHVALHAGKLAHRDSKTEVKSWRAG